MNEVILYEGVRASGKTHNLVKMAKRLKEEGCNIVVVAPTMNIAGAFCEQAGLPRECTMNNVKSLKGLNNVDILVEQWWDLNEDIRKELMILVRRPDINVIAVSDPPRTNIVIKNISAFPRDWGFE